MSKNAPQEILSANQRLLESILAADWTTYAELCDASITAFEPEAKGQRVEGLPFHEFYFGLGSASAPYRVTMASPHVRMLGDDAAVLSYVRLVQKLAPGGAPVTTAVEETRVWQRIGGQWRHVHFHRSAPTT